MKSWHIICIVAAALAAPGCRSQANYDPLYREMRWLEDRIYDLEDDLDQAASDVDRCHAENLALRKRLADAGVAEDIAPRTVAPVLPPRPAPSPAIDPAPTDRMTPPQVEGIPDPGADDELRMPGADPRSANRKSARAADTTEELADEGESETLLKRITLNRARTGGHDADGVPGDEALRVVLEPRSPSGAVVDVPGDISIVLLDPAREGAAARVARWDITASHTAELLRETPVGEGVQLDLPWPEDPPTNGTLMLFVRYATSDGGKYVAEQQIEVNPPGSPRIMPPTSSTRAAPPAAFTPDSESEQPLSSAPEAASTAEAPDKDKPSTAKAPPAERKAAKPGRPQWTPYR